MYETKITRTLEENPGAREVRTPGVVEEQGYQNEFDSHDADAVHLCLYDGGRGVATAGPTAIRRMGCMCWGVWRCCRTFGAGGWAAGWCGSWRNSSGGWAPGDPAVQPAARHEDVCGAGLPARGGNDL